MPRHEYIWGWVEHQGKLFLIREEKLYPLTDSEATATWYLDDQGEWVRFDGVIPGGAAVPRKRREGT